MHQEYIPIGVRHLAIAVVLCLATHRAETDENSALEESLKGRYCSKLIKLVKRIPTPTIYAS